MSRRIGPKDDDGYAHWRARRIRELQRYLLVCEPRKRLWAKMQLRGLLTQLEPEARRQFLPPYSDWPRRTPEEGA